MTSTDVRFTPKSGHRNWPCNSGSLATSPVKWLGKGIKTERNESYRQGLPRIHCPVGTGMAVDGDGRAMTVMDYIAISVLIVGLVYGMAMARSTRLIADRRR